MVGEKRIQEINNLVAIHGVDKTALITGLSTESISRYCRHVTQPEEAPPLSKVLILDIETSPMTAYVWGMWKNNVSQNQMIHDWFIISWSVKWLFDKEVYSSAVTVDEVLRRDDSRIVKELWEYVEEAEIIIGHNARRFDMPKSNTRFLLHGLTPPSPYLIIDTLDALRKNFKVSSNRLNYVNAFLGLDVKVDTGGFELWANCLNGDQDALDSMETYNRNEVLILEELYVKIRPWIKPHPNIALYSDSVDSCCPACASKELEYAGYYTTPANRYKAWRCKECGAIGRSRASQTAKGKRANLLISTAK